MPKPEVPSRVATLTKRMRSRGLIQLAVVAVLAAVVVAGAILISSGGGDEEQAPPATASTQVEDLYAGIPQDGIRLGSRDAPATLVEFADLQCPFCARYSTEAMPAIVRDYVRSGKVAYELRIRAFLGRDSVRAAGAAAYAAGENRLYQFADLFYRNQGLENSDYVDDAFVRGLAEQVPGLDPQRAVAAADDPLRYPLVRAGERQAQKAGSTSTPDFYVRRGDGPLQPLRPQGTTPEAYAQALDDALS
jgi:protein-disulfide isomerase